MLFATQSLLIYSSNAESQIGTQALGLWINSRDENRSLSLGAEAWYSMMGFKEWIWSCFRFPDFVQSGCRAGSREC